MSRPVTRTRLRSPSNRSRIIGSRKGGAVIGTALRDLDGGDLPGPAKVRRFIELAMKQAARPVGAGGPPGGGTVGDQVERVVRRMEAKHAAR